LELRWRERSNNIDGVAGVDCRFGHPAGILLSARLQPDGSAIQQRYPQWLDGERPNARRLFALRSQRSGVVNQRNIIDPCGNAEAQRWSDV
jgi:hypothetical protein